MSYTYVEKYSRNNMKLIEKSANYLPFKTHLKFILAFPFLSSDVPILATPILRMQNTSGFKF